MTYDQRPPGGLSARDLDVLEFAKLTWTHLGRRETAIRDRFDMTETRYYAILNWLLDQPTALAAQPQLVRRLLRLRDQRRRTRSPRAGLDR